MPLDDFGRDYLRLTLEIDKHIHGYVDAYSGPPELKEAVAATDPRPIEALQDDLAALRDNTPTADPARQRYLEAIFRAMACTLAMQQGEAIGYLDEVNRLYDITPALLDEKQLEAAGEELLTLLPGDGSATERMDARRKRYELPTDRLLALLEMARDEARRRTAKLVDLVDGEAVTLALVSDQPWGAYNWYQGGGRSLVEFNTDIPINALSLADLMAHEAYPGHHTEALIKEKYLYQEKGYAEQAAALLHSPSAVIAEGIATTAAEIIFPDGALYEWLLGELLPAAGITTAETPEMMQQIDQASRLLRSAGCNAAILYHTGELDRAAAIDYLQSYGLSTRERAEKLFHFISNPLFRAYIFTYTIGYDLIDAAADGGDKLPLFRRLLFEQVLPSELGS